MSTTAGIAARAARAARAVPSRRSPGLDRAALARGQFAIYREDLAWFFGTLAFALLGGVWMLYVAEIYVGDAVARVANAHHIVFSRDPHLAAVGFIWPPLPSLLEMPLLLVLRPLGQAIFAAQIVSALFTALLAVTVNRTLALWLPSIRWRVALTLAVLTNPLIVFAAINGMTENIFLFFIAGATYYLLVWNTTRSEVLVVAGLLAGFSTFVRYESVPFAAAAVVGIVVLAYDVKRPERLEAYLTTFVAPVAFMILLWVFFNAIFVGDPLFFLRGIGSNEFYTQGTGESDPRLLGQTFDSSLTTLRLGIERLLRVYPAALPVAALSLVVAVRRRDRVLLMLLLLAASVPAFEMLQMHRGQLFVWVRFWIYPALFTPLLAVAAARHYRLRWRRRLYATALAVAVLSSVSTLHSMSGVQAAPGEQSLGGLVLEADPGAFAERQSDDLLGFRNMAATLDELHRAEPDAVVLMDTFIHFALVLYVEHPKMLMVASDRDFKKTLIAPPGRVQYILVPPPSGVAAVTDINRLQPDLYRGGVPWAELVQEFPELGNARLYRVRPSTVAR